MLGQWGIHLAHPLIDLEGERVPPPTERQIHDTGIRDRATFGDPPLPHEVFTTSLNVGGLRRSAVAVSVTLASV